MVQPVQVIVHKSRQATVADDSRSSIHDPLQFVGPDFRRVCGQ